MVCIGSKIGPLVAESVEVADLLRRTIVAGMSPETKVSLEIAEPNPASIDLAGRVGLTKIGKTFRVYRRSAPKLFLERILAVTWRPTLVL